MDNLRRVILFLVDGMRPDGLRKAKTPFFDKIPSQGTYTFHARSVFPPITLPCHTSLFYSLAPGRHGIHCNSWQELPSPVPSLIDVIHNQNKIAAMFYNWEELRNLSRPGSLSASFFLTDIPDDNGQTDREIAFFAKSWLKSHEWSFAFVYLHNTDKAGHKFGWMSDGYLDAIGNADACIKEVCSIVPEDAVVIVTSDHGGHENTHDSDIEEDMTIPILLYGAGIPAAQEIKGQISIMDIAPTVLRLLGLDSPGIWSGRPFI